MNRITQIILLLLAFLLPATAMAYNFEMDGIYYNIINGNEVEVTHGYYVGPENNAYIGDVTIPASITYNSTTYSVTSIGVDAFHGCSRMTSVNIPSSITSIGNGAFSYCNGLTNVTIPNSVISIGKEAFSECSNLAIVNISNSVPFISNRAFSHCTALISVNIPNSVTYIDNFAFDSCISLVSVEIPNSVTSIGTFAFRGCSALTSIDIPNFLTSISEQAFAGCSGLISVAIPNSVTTIGNAAFTGCSSLTSVTIPNSLTSIGGWVFEGCSGLTSVAIPNSVTAIGNAAFSGCSGLTSVTIPNSVTSIGNSAFQCCSGLTSVDIPNSVTSIGYAAFSGCSGLTSVTIPNSVASIGDRAFAWCPALNDVFSFITELETIWTGGGIFSLEPEPRINNANTNNIQTLHVPTGTISSYQNHEMGAYFDTIVEMEPGATNYIFMHDATAKCGDTIMIPVNLDNNLVLMAFQTDVFLPEGFSIVKDEDDEYIVTPAERLPSDHVLITNDANNGSVRVLCYTPNALPINGSEGELFYITVKVPEDAEGLYTIALRNSLLTTAEYQEISIPDAEGQMDIYAFIPGDVNDSRTVNVTDIVVTAMYVLDMNPSPFIFEAADMNGDGNVTVTDIMLIAYLINHPTMNAPKHMPALMDCNDRMNAESATLEAGETRTVSIKLDNEMDYTAFQMDLTLPEGLTASNFQLTERAGSLALDVNMLGNGKTRALCYSPAAEVIKGHNGALLTFDVTAATAIKGDIAVDGIELVNANCQTVLLDGFAIGVNTTMTSVNELSNAKAVARVDYYNLAGQQIDRPESGVTFVITTFTDGTRTTTKVIK